MSAGRNSRDSPGLTTPADGRSASNPPTAGSQVETTWRDAHVRRQAAIDGFVPPNLRAGNLEPRNCHQPDDSRPEEAAIPLGRLRITRD